MIEIAWIASVLMTGDTSVVKCLILDNLGNPTDFVHWVAKIFKSSNNALKGKALWIIGNSFEENSVDDNLTNADILILHTGFLEELYYLLCVSAPSISFLSTAAWVLTNMEDQSHFKTEL